jgi:transposase
MEQKNKIFIGIDVSKETLDIFMDSKHSKIQNTSLAISSFIKNDISDKKIQLCVLESTGGYEKLAMSVMQQAGIPVHKAHPNKVHSFAKASGHFAKTDKLDAKLLEKYASFVSDTEQGDEPLSQAQIDLRELRSIQRDLEDSLHAYQCRLQHANKISKSHIEKHIEHIKKQLNEIGDNVEKVINEDEELKIKHELLTSYKGVGSKISTILIAELPELGRLNTKEIGSLTGLVPKTYESGKKTSNGHITGGRFYARKALYMAALVAMRYNDKMKTMYNRLLEAGKPKKVALVAIMHKIIICLNSMLKNNKAYML